MGYLDNMIIRIPGLLIALTIHEFSHAVAAKLCGDDTAQRAGRLTLNPFSHLDILGTLMILSGPFGWAKPVPVSPRQMRHPRFDDILVSLAGPASNIVCAVISGLLNRFVFMHGGPLSDADLDYSRAIIETAIGINIGIAFFNLLPFPPLDGSHMLAGLVPRSLVVPYYRIMRHVPMVFVALMSIEWLSGGRIPAISFILGPLYQPWAQFWRSLIFGT